MRKIRLTKEERAIEDSLEKFIPLSRQEYAEVTQAIDARRKDAVLNIRINSRDLENIKQKAKKLGIKYQTFIAEFLHRLAG